ncbi:LytR/AlgR family response regulator transcription factor [Roseivirga sp.]|uniref:LytR/AlgR family response regulator transcription factor n=1 Tax=Roseivirga sp. TaxID=1964215 RepID=UPI003B8B8ED0
MSNFLNWFRKHLQSLLLTMLCFTVFIVFESFQQLFYSNNFNNGVPSDVGFWDVLQGGLYRWLIWGGIAIPLVMLINRYPIKENKRQHLLVHSLLIIGALFLNLMLVTSTNGAVQANFWASFPEVFEFYFFHKAPIILVALIVLVLLVDYFKNQDILEVTLRQVGELKKANEVLYQELEKGQLSEDSLVIEVKTGNRIRLISENVIRWLEADDYCVKIHDNDGSIHTLRSSLKAFEQKLPSSKFLRVHRKAIVNLDCIVEYQLGTNPTLKLSDGAELPIAQSRVKAFRNQLNLA